MQRISDRLPKETEQVTKKEKKGRRKKSRRFDKSSGKKRGKNQIPRSEYWSRNQKITKRTDISRIST